jgi:selenocysteine-specific elongation factor
MRTGPLRTGTTGPLTLGTAGHIDHGKTELVHALTGTDTDRLPQERSRGISIELGYASLTLPSGRRLSVIDVPGHERFVRAMVAGATGIDLYLMTIAADDGVMPQTREHAAILRALAIGAGVVAITKADLADPAPAIEQAAKLFPGAEVTIVSTRSGTGLDELTRALDRATATLSSRADVAGPARLHIDRAFTIKGAGTVVTGTLWSGSIRRGDRLTVLPAGTPARVRGVQVHDEPVELARAGQRVAVNLTVDLDEVTRGDVIAEPGAELAPTHLVDAALEFAPQAAEPEHGDRVQVHHGTRESPARLAWLGGRFWQLRLERPLVPAAGDRLVIRRIAPPDTLGGGTVLDAHPRKHGPGRETLTRLELLARGEPADQADSGAKMIAPAPPTARAPLTSSALALEQRLHAARFEPPLDAELDRGDLEALRAANRAVRVSKTLHYHPAALAEARARAIALAERHDGAITLAQLRDELGTSRKFAEALLAHLDSERVTLRRGDTHHLRRSAGGAAVDEPGPG